ncbi:MAG: hypothetical protein ACRD47_10370, partial [Nitrososphaeraceae archaeon]
TGGQNIIGNILMFSPTAQMFRDAIVRLYIIHDRLPSSTSIPRKEWIETAVNETIRVTISKAPI